MEIINYINNFINNITFEMALKIAVLYFLIIWISLIVWVIKDINNRTESILFQIFCVIWIIFTTPLGIFIYLLIRPSQTLYEKYYEDIEDNLDTFSNMLNKKNEMLEQNHDCKKCQKSISIDFKFCPHCSYEIKKKCKTCKKSILRSWKNCPYCGD